jgi:hypothetical protein
MIGGAANPHRGQTLGTSFIDFAGMIAMHSIAASATSSSSRTRSDEILRSSTPLKTVARG